MCPFNLKCLIFLSTAVCHIFCEVTLSLRKALYKQKLLFIISPPNQNLKPTTSLCLLQHYGAIEDLHELSCNLQLSAITADPCFKLWIGALGLNFMPEKNAVKHFKLHTDGQKHKL